MDTGSKNLALHLLARKRRASCWPGYNAIGDYHQGLYECPFVSPYTRTAGNPNSDLMIVLQDWSSHDHLAGPPNHRVAREGREAALPTNRHLDRLLETHFQRPISSCYATNLFPFIKLGGMSARIPVADLVRAACEFTLPEISIVRPRLVVVLGLPAFNALRRARDLKPVRNLDEGIAAELDFEGVRIWCQAHTGALGRNNRNRGGADRVTGDWAAMAAWYQSQGVGSDY